MVYFLAMLMTKRRFASTISFLASRTFLSPLVMACSNSFSSALDSLRLLLRPLDLSHPPLVDLLQLGHLLLLHLESHAETLQVLRACDWRSKILRASSGEIRRALSTSAISLSPCSILSSRFFSRDRIRSITF